MGGKKGRKEKRERWDDPHPIPPSLYASFFSVPLAGASTGCKCTLRCSQLTVTMKHSSLAACVGIIMCASLLKAAKYEIQKPSTCRATLFSLHVLVDVSRFSPCMINLIRNRNICCRSKKCSALIGWFARARANLLRAKLRVWWKTSNKAKICCAK